MALRADLLGGDAEALEVGEGIGAAVGQRLDVAHDHLPGFDVHVLPEGLGHALQHRVAQRDGAGSIGGHADHVGLEAAALPVHDPALHLVGDGDVPLQVVEDALGDDELALVIDDAGAGAVVAPRRGNHLGEPSGRAFDGLAVARQRIDALLSDALAQRDHLDGFVAELLQRAGEAAGGADLLLNFRAVDHRGHALLGDELAFLYLGIH
ncbi:hypothetical protein G6F59_015048 [Rhizopus arrhizus]|nr:hypothetical protein G6F59_015048 [Rhizopus arrhizus]